VARYADGSVRVVSIDEVQGATEQGFTLQQLFCFDGNGYAGAGVAPAFFGELQARGMAADSSIFQG
jgi:hypothetical protein